MPIYRPKEHSLALYTLDEDDADGINAAIVEKVGNLPTLVLNMLVQPGDRVSINIDAVSDYLDEDGNINFLISGPLLLPNLEHYYVHDIPGYHKTLPETYNVIPLKFRGTWTWVWGPNKMEAIIPGASKKSWNDYYAINEVTLKPVDDDFDGDFIVSPKTAAAYRKYHKLLPHDIEVAYEEYTNVSDNRIVEFPSISDSGVEELLDRLTLGSNELPTTHDMLNNAFGIGLNLDADGNVISGQLLEDVDSVRGRTFNLVLATLPEGAMRQSAINTISPSIPGHEEPSILEKSFTIFSKTNASQ